MALRILVIDHNPERAAVVRQALVDVGGFLVEVAPKAVQVLDVVTGDPDLLTVRAARLIRMADIILYDPAIEAAILDLARSGAIKVRGAPNASVDERARSGKIVVHLRSGSGAVAQSPHSRSMVDMPMVVVPAAVPQRRCTGHHPMTLCEW